MLSIVGCVHAREAKERILENPLIFLHLFDPVPSDRKVAVGVTSLPRVACKINLTSNGLALKKKWDLDSLVKKITHV